MVKMLSEYFKISPDNLEKLLLSLGIIIFLTIARFISNYLVKRKIPDDMRAYHWRRAILYIYTILLIILTGIHLVQGNPFTHHYPGIGKCGYCDRHA